MSSKQLSIIIFVGLIIVGAVTNPSYDDHKRAVSKVLSKMTNDTSVNEKPKNEWKQLGNMLGNKLIVGMIDNVLSVNNFIFFSLGYINWEDSKRMVTIGAFGNVFELSPSNSLSNKSNKTIDKSEAYYEEEKIVIDYGLTIGKNIGEPFKSFNVVCTKLPSENNGYADFKVSYEGTEDIIENVQITFYPKEKIYSDNKIVKPFRSLKKGQTKTISINLKNSKLLTIFTLVAKGSLCNTKVTNDCGLEVGSIMGEKNLYIECLKIPTENCGEAEFLIENVGDRDYMRFTITFYDKSNSSNDEKHKKKIGFVKMDEPIKYKLDLTNSKIRELGVKVEY